MEQKSLEDALNDGYYVRVKNEQEINLFLQSCQDRGLKWRSGEDATDYDPPFDTKAITYKHKALTFSIYLDDKDNIVNWSDLLLTQSFKEPKFTY